jgi:hypothetical protein
MSAFWEKLDQYWDKIYTGIKDGTAEQRARCLEVINGFLTEEQFKKIEIELTFGEVNRVSMPHAKNLVEMYISPRLRKENIPDMEELFKFRKPLPNLHVVKYRAYNPNSEIIASVEYEDFTTKYEDFGCQVIKEYDEEKKPIISIILHVKKLIADKFLVKKPVTFIYPDGKKKTEDKLVPNGPSVIDLFLTNILGEYNLVNHVGAIEFLVEGDPIIANGSIFTELADLRQEILAIEKLRDVKICSHCSRRQYQCQLSKCSRCHKTLYCSKDCQIANWSIHKHICQTKEEREKIKRDAHNKIRDANIKKQEEIAIRAKIAKAEKAANKALQRQKDRDAQISRRAKIQAERKAKREEKERLDLLEKNRIEKLLNFSNN